MDQVNESRTAAPPAGSANAQSGNRDSLQPSTDSVPRSQSQKRKDRRKNAAERKRQQEQPSGASASGNADVDSSVSNPEPSFSSPSPLDSSNVPTSSSSSSSSFSSSSRGGSALDRSSSQKSGGKGGHSSPHSNLLDGSDGGAPRRKQGQDLRQLLKEETLAAQAPRRRQNLSGFGDEDTSSALLSSSSSLLSAASPEYVPSYASASPRPQSKPKVIVATPGSPAPRLQLAQVTEGQTELATKIIQELVENRYECDICFVPIRRSVATWSCSNCYSIFHLVCAKKWARSVRDPNAGPDAPITRWHCPKCRHGHDGVPNPWCFCGKLKNPPNDPMKVPHSCGDVCLRPRSGTSCPHTCTLLCHPGPCPPCAAMGPLKHCWCGRATYRLRCGQQDDGQSCGQSCGKSLNCSRHKCLLTCHSNACSPCSQQVDQKCYCGKTTATRTCGAQDEHEDTSSGESRFFSCHTPCDHLLDCGNHRCKKVCHFGPCEPCQLQPALVKMCGCGSHSILHVRNGVPRTSCMDDIPSCKSVCNKIRECGHRCTDMCHPGPCSPCEVEIQVPCRCHTSTKPMKCCDVFPNQKVITASFVCERICGRMKACGKHQCSTRCCPSYYDSTDPEGFHVCRVTCNKRLNCGKHLCKQACHKGRCDRCLEAIFHDVVCACGKTIQEAPIPCGTAPLVCPHPCSKSRPCGHPANTHTCHEGECPPCLIPVEKPCAGGHTVMLNIPCYKQNMSCGVSCNKPMACGLHNCKRICHAGPCEMPLPEGAPEPAPGQKRSCGQLCKSALYSCEHSCLATCHPGQPCPDVQCTQMSKVSCECGVNTGEIPCTGKTKKVLPCTNACESAKRQKRLAEAFGIYGTATSAPRYPDLLLNMACVAPIFITRIEKWLDDFVKTPATVTRQELPPLDRVQRQCVHELAKFYGIGTESTGSDERKQRAITLTKRRDCKAPSVPLTTVANVTGLFDHSGASGGSSAPSSSSSSSAAAASSSSSFALEYAPSSTLHIYDLHKGILTNTIHSFLSGFHNEYTLQWVDDENCLAIFSDPNRMQRALNTLQPRGTFKVKPYQDINPEPISTGMVSLGSTTSAWKSPEASSAFTPTTTSIPKAKNQFESGHKPQSVWNRNANPFSVLEASSPSTSKNVSQGSLMMWNLGEGETPASAMAATASSASSTSTASSAVSDLPTTGTSSPSTSYEPILDFSEPHVVKPKEPVVQSWTDLSTDEDVPEPGAYH